MEIIDLSEAYYPQYLCCLEDWSDDIKEAGDGKRLWFEMMHEKGLRVKLAVIDGRAVSTGPPPACSAAVTVPVASTNLRNSPTLTSVRSISKPPTRCMSARAGLVSPARASTTVRRYLVRMNRKAIPPARHRTA